jgi:hypothetical protein
MDNPKPIKEITILTDEGDYFFESNENLQLVDAITENGTAFIVHEQNAIGELLRTTVYPMPGNGGIVAIEIERG